MKNIIMTNDNVLVKATFENIGAKSGIVLPENVKKNPENANLEKLLKLEVIKIGNVAQKSLPELKEGDEILIDANLGTLMSFNESVGAKFPKTTDKTYFYFHIIKSFNIISIIKK